MNTIELLEECKKYEFIIENLIRERKSIEDMACSIGGMGDGMPHGSGVSDKVGNAAARLVDIQEEIAGRVADYAEARNRLSVALEELPTAEYKVLYLRYVKGLKWADIEQELGYSSAQVHRIKRKAIKRLKMTHYDTK